MIDNHKKIEPLIQQQDGNGDMTPTEHSYTYYNEENSKWLCKCGKVNETPPAEDGLLHCDCGAVCQIAPKVTDYYVHGGEYADFFCPICDQIELSVINDGNQVECSRCDIWLDLA